MKKINLIETIQDFLASDAAGDSKGIYHPEIIKIHLNDVFNDIIDSTYIAGKKSSDFSQLDAWSRTYTLSVLNQIGTNAYCFVPFPPVQLLDGAGIRQVCDHADNGNVFAPTEATSDVVFAELEVSTMDSTPTYHLEQNYMAIEAGMGSHILRLGKMPTAIPIVSVDMLLVVPMSEIDDYDDIAMPRAMSDSMIRQVIDLMSKKPIPDVNNDMVIAK